jgi:alpha-glucosidase
VINGTSTTFNPVFTIPASADEGPNLLPNIDDPQAVDAQTVCPGYKAAQVKEDEHGLTAVLTLAGERCNVYGSDIEVLNLKVEYQGANRLAVNISPAHLVCGNLH